MCDQYFTCATVNESSSSCVTRHDFCLDLKFSVPTTYTLVRCISLCLARVLSINPPIHCTVSLILSHTTYLRHALYRKRSQVGVHSARSSIFKYNQINHQRRWRFFEDRQRSKKEPPHSRDGTPWGELTIPYIDLIWGCARRKTPET